MDVRSIAASLILATALSAQATVAIDQGGIGCGQLGALLDDETSASGKVTFTYDPAKAWLRVTVENTTPVLPGVSTATITRVYFNAPAGTVTGAQLMWQLSDGPTPPAFVFGFDADAGDGEDPNRAGCLGTFNFRLASSSVKDGVANAEAFQVCGSDKGPLVTGPVHFVFQLTGPEVHNLRSDTFTAATSRNSETPVNVALKFDGSNCQGSGTIGNGDICRTAVFVRGTPALGQSIALAVVGGERCRAFLGVTDVPGPADLKFLTLPIGLPVLFTWDFGYLPPIVPEVGLPVFIPFAPELIGFHVYMTSFTHPWLQDEVGPFGFAEAYDFTITGFQDF